MVFVCHLKYLPTSSSWRHSPVFSFKGFKGLDFMFRPLMHLKLIFVYAVRQRPRWRFFHRAIQLCQHLLLQKIFISWWMISAILSKINSHICVNFFLDSLFCFINLHCTNVLVPPLYLITVALYSGGVSAPLSFFFKIVYATSFGFPLNFRISFLISYKKNAAWN